MAEKNEKLVSLVDLTKALDALEGKAAEKPEEPVEKVRVTILNKTAETAIKENLNKSAQKAVDVSEFLQEMTSAVGEHIDQAVQSMEKSLEAGANQNLAIVRVLEKMQKTISDLGEEVKKIGNAPTQPASQRTPSTPATEILLKGADDKEKSVPVTRNRVISILQQMMKSAEKGSSEEKQLTIALAGFESSGRLGDGIAQQVLAELKKAA